MFFTRAVISGNKEPDIMESSDDDDDNIYSSISDLKMFEDTKPFPGCLMVNVIEFMEKKVSSNKGALFSMFA